MYGKVIGTSIAVDSFHEVTKDGIYFLTEGQLDAPLPTHVDRVYTSPYNARLLLTKFQVHPDKIISLPINEKLLIEDNIKNLNFNVTLIDAKQKPGAVMFLFEGDDIGSILYAGKCCYGETCLLRPLQSFLKVKKLDFLYVHPACPDCESHSLSVASAVDDIVNIIRWNPNCKIVINDPCFREDILSYLKDRIRSRICVSENVMKHLEEVGQGADFDLDHNAAQIIVTDKLHHNMRFSKQQPVFKVVLIPCSMKRSSVEIKMKVYNLSRKGYHVILYRNHCSPPELISMARDIDAKHTVLIRPPAVTPLTEREKSLSFWSHLGDFHRIIQFSESIADETRQLAIAKDDDLEVSSAELQNAVECIIVDKEDHTVDLVDKTDSPRGSELSPPSSFILIDSDIVTVASNDTVLREGGLV
ncbi:5' exonuclease Apollo-like isoform X1 [Homalodisca vitripennis]|uniref:5' exonuclease Apollo-like isoform X1 n=1 Tax=Homalodisca vitripennis TaxID=197043 RepID=UPI001EEA7608|nr:5' exonuclease Apollo-like isoform X1 [Homalodisca vitripennis]XP_046669049.1 5' exonuclease Apollo-like isoform X1 [Homalodisca vitripennis]